MYTIINIVLLLVIIKLVYSLNWEGYTREQLDELSRLLDASFRGPNGQYPIDKHASEIERMLGGKIRRIPSFDCRG